MATQRRRGSLRKGQNLRKALKQMKKDDLVKLLTGKKRRSVKRRKPATKRRTVRRVRKTRKMTQFQKSLKATRTAVKRVPRAMKPVVRHIIKLALHSHKVGAYKRAGIELRKARQLSAK